MKYIKLFNENTLECHVKDYFNNILDNQDVVYKEKAIIPIVRDKYIAKHIYLTYEGTHSFDKDDLDESINKLKDDGFNIFENRIFFYFEDIENIPFHSFNINDIPYKHELISLHNIDFEKNGESYYPEDYEEGCLKIGIDIYK